MKPSVGRIVHYVVERSPDDTLRPGLQCIAALVVDVGEDDVTLLPFFPWPSSTLPISLVRHSETPLVGTWHWPERL